MNSSPFALAILIVLVAWITRLLADKEARKVVLTWTLFGILIGILKNLLVQMTPQWSDVPVDSLTYQLHAEALFMHWSGLPVDAHAYDLAGYLNGWQQLYDDMWMPDSRIAYASALGTHEWIYAAFLALWQVNGSDWVGVAILANAVLAGALPAAAFMITKELGGSFKICNLAALIVALDPSTAINSAWLIKDSLAALISVVAIIAICNLCKKPSLKFTLILALTLGLLAGVRFVAYIAFGVVMAGLVIYLIIKKTKVRAANLTVAGVISLALWVALYLVPSPPTPKQVIQAITSPIQAQATTLKADKNETGSDESVIQWRTYLNDNPLKAATRAIARTLFAPYPWTAITEGVTGTNHIELYLFGTLFWIITLPGIFMGMAIATRHGMTGYALVALIVVITIPYLIFFGEWSTRQRVFMMPLFFSFAAIGWHHIWQLSLKRSPRRTLSGPLTNQYD
ncbi:hypothetical protein NVV94_19620 [Pseudomonas sp. LS1212]|uniref:hypothetical protein n=1 Tax=Pseudomonas sp. LS1212 TaxID=2972478 RepID=UPI00215CBF7F|nr:hypothetical protein [Pseudomonas sp. LS1212]UVJ42787.1 hypothetical protein NVV94_19620 [Pseudomonas sp. LS1212]